MKHALIESHDFAEVTRLNGVPQRDVDETIRQAYDSLNHLVEESNGQRMSVIILPITCGPAAYQKAIQATIVGCYIHIKTIASWTEIVALFRICSETKEKKIIEGIWNPKILTISLAA